MMPFHDRNRDLVNVISSSNTAACFSPSPLSSQFRPSPCILQSLAQNTHNMSQTTDIPSIIDEVPFFSICLSQAISEYATLTLLGGLYGKSKIC